MVSAVATSASVAAAVAEAVAAVTTKFVKNKDCFIVSKTCLITVNQHELYSNVMSNLIRNNAIKSHY